MRLVSLAFLVLAWFGSPHALAASSCELMKLAQEKNVSAEFWDEFAELSEAGNNLGLKALAAKYGLDSVKVSDEPPKAVEKAKAKTPEYEVGMAKPAKRAYKKYRKDKVIQESIAEFMELGRGGWKNLSEVAKQRGWDFKPNKGFSDRYTIRVNSGFRIGFRKLDDGGVEIIDLGNNIYTHK